nr:hypothetical protein BaRGS_032390 [Batillaria attramentaria]
MFSDALQAMKDAYNKEFIIFNAKRGKDATTASQILALAAKIILLVVRCDVRYTAEEYAIYKKIKELWGDKSLCERLVVAFTFWDRQKSDIEKELNTTVPQELKNVLKDASNRYVVFNNSDNRPCLSEEQEEVGGDSLIVFSRGDSQLEREQKIHRLFARLDDFAARSSKFQ